MNTTGIFFNPQQRGHFETHFQYSGNNRLFSVPECAAIIALAEKAGGFREAAVGNPDQSRVDRGIRQAKICLLESNADSEWVYERLAARMDAANTQHYRFAITGFMEALQVVRYDMPATGEDHPGHYDWHQDFGAAYMSRRKLSLVAQLSSPNDYDGCRLVIPNPSPVELTGPYVERGAGVVFPSWTPHCVTAITRGTRYSLVAWVHGEPFR